MIDREERILVTSHPEFAHAALAELKQIDQRVTVLEQVAPGILLCTVANSSLLARRAVNEHLIFVRHLAPVQDTVPITGSEQDIGRIAVALAELPTFALLERGVRFAVQSRFTHVDKSEGARAYSTGQLNQFLATALTEETGAIESVKRPQIVVSLLCTIRECYLGISHVEENLSSWPGGARHFAHTSEQMSRAEFKLLEALEVFQLELPKGGRALDLGAAPGGWTRLLLEAGMNVVAVDPALLDARLAHAPHLEHYRGYAEHYVERAVQQHVRFDVITNDMRMDARDAARIMVLAARCLRNDGFALSTLKLPHTTHEINPLKTLHTALDILGQHFGILRARQLFHNRQEVTVVAARPLATRR